MNSIHTIRLLALLASSAAVAAERPNIPFILADAWGWGDLSCHGHPYVKTPNIDRLAKEGTDFYRFTVASGVCSPSRTAVMTGHFPARYNIDGHFAWVPQNAKRNMPDWLDPKSPLLSRFLQQVLEELDEWKATLPAKPTGNVFSAERSKSEGSP